MSTTEAGPPSVVGGRYSVGDLIGRGGAADVYRARDELLGRDVAIKMFGAGGDVVADANAASGASGASAAGPDAEPAVDLPGGPDDGSGGEGARYGRGDGGSGPRPAAPPAELVGDLEEGSDARNRREVLTLAALSHPGLVTVYDVGDDRGRAYFVMQLIEGDTLAQRIRRGPLPLGDVVALGAALADALGYVHRRGVVHRDVKPGNVLLDAEGRAHLSDFGIAAVRDAAPVTAAGMVIGTASYLSPEQVRGEAVTPAVDVYALGLVLVECLTGRREYPGNALEAAVARLHRRPAVPTQLPDSLRTLLVAMTADEPAARPEADEVLAGMRAVSREIGLDAETVLSPALMSAPTGVVPLASGPAAQASAPMLAAGAPTGAHVPDAPTGAAPARSRRRGVLVAVGVALAAVLVVGSALAYTLVAGARATPLPAPSTVPAPPAPAVVVPATTAAPEPAGSTRARATTTRTRARTTTASPAPVAPAAPVVPPAAPVATTPVVPPPVVTTEPAPRSTTPVTTTTAAARGQALAAGG